MTEEKRIAWIDWAKGFTILAVVVFHSFAGIASARIVSGNWELINKVGIFTIGTFIMPVFFALSGVVYRSIRSVEEYKFKMMKRFVSLIVVYIIFSIIVVVMQELAPGGVLNSSGYSWYSLLWIWYKPIWHLWYLYALILIYFWCGLLDLLKLSIESQTVISLVLFVFALIFNPLPFLQYPFTWMITFNMGRLLKKYPNIILHRKKIYFVVSLIIMIIALIVQVKFSNENWYMTNDLTFVNFVSKISSIPVLLYIYAHLTLNKFTEYFEKIGKGSLVIYLVHVPVASVTRIILVRLLHFSNYICLLLTLTLIVWLISTFVYWLSKKVKLINFIFYPTRYLKL